MKKIFEKRGYSFAIKILIELICKKAHFLQNYANEKYLKSEIYFFPGAYVPLTEEGTIIVDGILASCYATFNHDLAHLVMTPMQWFPSITEWIFGQEHGIQGFVKIAKTLGRYLTPNVYLNHRNTFWN